MPFFTSVSPSPRRPRTRHRIRRWRFPAGTIHLVGGGYRWERIEDGGAGGYTLLSGPLDVSHGVGYLGAADLELPMAAELGAEAYDALPDFPVCHLFYDSELAGRGFPGFGPWFCLCGRWESSLPLVQSGCGRSQGRSAS